MWFKIFAIARKELFHILRDPRTLGIVLVMPLVMLTIFGFAISFEVKNYPTVIMDEDHSLQSRSLVRQLTASGYFKLKAYLLSYREVRFFLDSGRAKAALIIPTDFSEKLSRGESAPLQFLVDGSDPNAANIALGYFAGISGSFAQEKLSLRAKSSRRAQSLPPKPPIDLRLRVLYNPELKTNNFIVPGLIAIIMMMVGAVLTAVAITRERENRTLEGLLATPIRPREFLLGKLTPYVAIAFLDLILILLAGRLVFQVPLKGNPLLLLLGSFFFLVAALGIGMLVSTLTSSQQTAMLMAFFISMLPSFMLSGFVFPLRSMPWFLQGISFLVPARYFLAILRGVLLKGVGITALYPHFLGLMLLSFLILFLSIKRLQREF